MCAVGIALLNVYGVIILSISWPGILPNEPIATLLTELDAIDSGELGRRHPKKGQILITPYKNHNIFSFDRSNKKKLMTFHPEMSSNERRTTL